MPGSDNNQTATAAASKVGDFGYLREGGRLEVDFRARAEGPSPGAVGVRDGGGGEGDAI